MLQKDESVLENERLFLSYQGGDRPQWADNLIEDREFLLGEQYSQAVKEAYTVKGLMAAPVNEVNPAIMLIVAQLTENDPRFAAIGREDSDVKVASYVSDLFQYIWDISKGRYHVKRFVKDFISVGISALMTYIDFYADNEKGEIKVCSIDPLELYIDPASKEPDSSDASNIILSKIISKEVRDFTYPDIDFTDAQPEKTNPYTRQRADTQGQVIFPTMPTNVEEYRVIDRYFKVKVPRYHVLDKNSNFEIVFENLDDFTKWQNEPAIIATKIRQPDTYIVLDDQVEELMNIYNTIGSTYHTMQDAMGNKQLMPGVEGGPFSIPNSTVQLKITAKGNLVRERALVYDEPKFDRIQRIFSRGGVKVTEEVLPIKDYPIVTCMLHHERTPFATGDVRLVKPIQEQLNILDSRIQAYLRLITTLRTFVNKNSGLKKKLDEAGDPMGMEVYEVDLETGGAPIFAQYPPLPQGVMQQRENFIRQIQRIVGAYSFQDGDATQAPQTSSGTGMIDEFMRRRSAYKKKIIEDSLDQLAKVVAQYVPLIYNDRKKISIISPNHGEARSVILNDPKTENGEIKLVNDLVTNAYDIRVISGSMLPSNRTAESQSLLKLYEMQVIHNPKWALQKMDFDNIQQIIEEEDVMKQMQGTIQQLEQQIKQLQGQLQTTTRETINANKKVEVEKFKSDLNGTSSELKSNIRLANARLGDMVKNEKLRALVDKPETN